MFLDQLHIHDYLNRNVEHMMIRGKKFWILTHISHTALMLILLTDEIIFYSIFVYVYMIPYV